MKRSTSQSYEQFLDLWKRPDPDPPLLAAARRELTALRSGAGVIRGRRRRGTV
jgi:hypothetical protein